MGACTWSAATPPAACIIGATAWADAEAVDVVDTTGAGMVSGAGSLPTRLVIPLLPAAAIPSPIERLHLRVTVDGSELVLATNLMASVRRDQLGPRVGSVADRRSEIVAAVDFLQQGF